MYVASLLQNLKRILEALAVRSFPMLSLQNRNSIPLGERELEDQFLRSHDPGGGVQDCVRRKLVLYGTNCQVLVPTSMTYIPSHRHVELALGEIHECSLAIPLFSNSETTSFVRFSSGATVPSSRLESFVSSTSALCLERGKSTHSLTHSGRMKSALFGGRVLRSDICCVLESTVYIEGRGIIYSRERARSAGPSLGSSCWMSHVHSCISFWYVYYVRIRSSYPHFTNLALKNKAGGEREMISGSVQWRKSAIFYQSLSPLAILFMMGPSLHFRF